MYVLFVLICGPHCHHHTFLNEGGVNCSDKAFGDRPSSLAVHNERARQIACTCTADCLTCLN